MFDIAVIGGGIVGLATARAAGLGRPGARIVVLDKEPSPARHQTGRNSGVVHSGIYYPPGSLKARMCLAGNRSMVEFARANEVPVEITGKLIAATDISEIPRLDALYERGLEHGLAVTRLGAAESREHEPHLAAIAAVHVASTGIVDYVAVCERLADQVRASGSEIRTATEVLGLQRSGATQRLTTSTGDIEARVVVNCAGLHSDEVAEFSGVRSGARIVPFRGEYFELRPEATHLVKGLIYPVPDPDFPFLGVHLTRSIDGSVHAGPNAVLAMAREGYRWRDLDLRELWGTLSYPGFRTLARRHLRQGLEEMARSVWRPMFLRSLQRLVPELTEHDLVRAPAGVRAQAVSRDGSLVDDFLIQEAPGQLHVLNAPSPAATSALEIGSEIASRLP